MDRLGNVLEPVRPHIVERVLHPVLHLIEYGARDADRARVGESLQPRCDVHPVAEHIAAIRDYLVEIDADAKLNAPVRRYIAIAVRDAGLHRCGAFDRCHDPRELHQHAIAGQVDDAPAAAGDLGLDQLPAMAFERRQGRGFAPPHEAAIADHVGGKNRGEPALIARSIRLRLPWQSTPRFSSRAAGERSHVRARTARACGRRW
jgi:hypothetical protein